MIDPENLAQKLRTLISRNNTILNNEGEDEKTLPDHLSLDDEEKYEDK